MTEKVQLHLLVHGRVQGVWFRGYSAEKALLLGLKGWVRNLPDGRVELRAQGPRDKLDSLLAAVRMGSPRSQVTNVEVNWEALGPQMAAFEIRREAG